MSKKCPKCGNIDCTIPKMEHHGEQWLSCLICGQTSRESRFNYVTLFDRITASPEVLAPQFVYHVTSFLDGLDKPKKIWYSTLIQGRAFASETEAKRATVAKLKEVCQ